MQVHAPYYVVLCGLSVGTIFFLNCTIFWKKFIENKTCVVIFCTNLSVLFFILKRIHQYIVIKVQISSCKVPVILIRF